jgi:hypothetical protein
MGWRNGRGQWQGAEGFDTSERELLEHVAKIPAVVKIVTVEESTLAAWVARTLQPQASEVIVCDPRRNESVHRDAFKNDRARSQMLHISKFGIVEKTHLYPEWRRHEAAIAGGSTRVPMDYLDFLDDPPPPVNPCHALTPEERQARQEQLKEMTDAVALWR